MRHLIKIPDNQEHKEIIANYSKAWRHDETKHVVRMKYEEKSEYDLFLPNNKIAK